MDPEDTRILDDVVRFIGQRVAAIVAESEAAAEEACRRIKVDYDILPALIDPEQAMAPGAPVLHPDRTTANRIADPQRNLAAETHGPSPNTSLDPEAADPYDSAPSTPRVALSISST